MDGVRRHLVSRVELQSVGRAGLHSVGRDRVYLVGGSKLLISAILTTFYLVLVISIMLYPIPNSSTLY